MIALYPRVSTQEQAKEGYSIDEQIDSLKSYCKAMKWKKYKLYVDAGFSGATKNRPALQEMITDIKAGKIKKVVVYKLDRLSRSQKDTLELIEDVFLANGCDFVSMSENFDTATPFGRAMIGILAVFAQLEREQIKERMTIGRTGRAKKGYFHGGGQPPIGYDYIDSKLIVNEYESMQIKEMFDLYLKGKSIRQIERTFDDKGYKTKYGNWNNKRLRKCLSNAVYIGKVKFDGHEYNGKHDAIIDPETFETANKIADERTKRFQEQRTGIRNTAYFGGLIYCAHCGGKYAVSSCFYKGKIYRYYTCYSRRKQNLSMIVDPNCKNKNYREEKLDTIIFDEIKKLAFDPEYLNRIIQAKKPSSNDDKIKILKKEIDSINAQRSRFMDLYGIGKFSIDELQEKIDPLNEQRNKLQAELDRLSDDQPAINEESIIKSAQSFSDALERGNREEIRLIIESLIDHIVIDNDDVIIHWKFA